MVITFKVGQRWHYKTRPKEEESTFTIVKIERHPDHGYILHVSVEGVRVENPFSTKGIVTVIPHLPFSHEALERSVTDLAEENVPLPTNFVEGYKIWQQAFNEGKAGIFTITVAEAVDYTEISLKKQYSQKRR